MFECLLFLNHFSKPFGSRVFRFLDFELVALDFPETGSLARICGNSPSDAPRAGPSPVSGCRRTPAGESALRCSADLPSRLLALDLLVD